MYFTFVNLKIYTPKGICFYYNTENLSSVELCFCTSAKSMFLSTFLLGCSIIPTIDTLTISCCTKKQSSHHTNTQSFTWFDNHTYVHRRETTALSLSFRVPTLYHLYNIHFLDLQKSPNTNDETTLKPIKLVLTKPVEMIQFTRNTRHNPTISSSHHSPSTL